MPIYGILVYSWDSNTNLWYIRIFLNLGLLEASGSSDMGGCQKLVEVENIWYGIYYIVCGREYMVCLLWGS